MSQASVGMVTISYWFQRQLSIDLASKPISGTRLQILKLTTSSKFLAGVEHGSQCRLLRGVNGQVVYGLYSDPHLGVGAIVRC